MKRFALLALSVLSLAACKDDPAPTASSYPTDGLALPQVKNAMALTSYLPTAGVATQIPSLIFKDAYQENFNYVNVVNNPTSPFYSPIADSITFNQPLQAPPSFYLNDQSADLLNIPAAAEAIDVALKKKPVASVNHKVTITDTAWVVDSKVKFWKDTANNGFRIATYMVASVKAAMYPNVNLLLNPSTGVIKTENDMSIWETAIPSLDSTSNVVSPGDIFYHQNILVKNFNEESAWGFPFTEYTPFGESFSAGDVIGTSTTPIRHYFPKPDSKIDGAFEPDFEFTPAFITVIWCQNADTYKYEYINCVMTELPLE